MDKNKTKQSKLNKRLKETGLFLADILYNAVIIIVLVVLIRSFLISPFRIVGSSMSNTLENKEFILINKLNYIVGSVHRGDPIVFLPPSTNKNSAKFEDVIQMDSSGSGKFDFSELKKTKNDDYCKGVLSVFWFCKEKVRTNDYIYYAPQKESNENFAKENDWKAVKRIQINETDYKNGFIELNGDVNHVYVVRIYDSRGPEYFVKRVIGIPGDTVKIENGRVYLKKVNESEFKKIDESFLNSENLNHTYISQRQMQSIYKVPEKHYFVMGDNRNHSNDSRSWLEPITQSPFPFVPEKNITGKVMIVLWPLKEFHLIKSADFWQ